MLVACSGLGRVQRGYEAFARECYEALCGRPDVDVWLVQGAGERDGRRLTVPSLARDSKAAVAISRRVPGGRGPYFVEQATFAAGMLAPIARLRPNVLLCSDVNIGNIYRRLRQVLPGNLRLLLSNGAPARPPFGSWDHVQHLTPDSRELAIAAGEDPARHTLLPYGFDLGAHPSTFAEEEVEATRNRLGLPSDRPIVLSVGALNANHKRMDVVINEIAKLSEPRPHLVLLGQRDDETPSIERLARSRLGPGATTIRTVPSTQVRDYYLASDVFFMASVSEGFGRVYVEALALGLACLVHDSPVTRYIYDSHARLVDLNRPGAGAAALADLLASPAPPALRRQRAEWARARFSWDALIDQYVDLIGRCASSPAVAR